MYLKGNTYRCNNQYLFMVREVVECHFVLAWQKTIRTSLWSNSLFKWQLGRSGYSAPPVRKRSMETLFCGSKTQGWRVVRLQKDWRQIVASAKDPRQIIESSSSEWEKVIEIDLYFFKQLNLYERWGKKKKRLLQPVWPELAIFCTLGSFLKPFATINLPKSPTFLGNFCKGAKIIHFSNEIIFGQLL